MKKNMGKLDKVVRLAIAVIISVLYVLGIITGTLGIILLLFVAVFALTSLISFCPLYTLFGMSTCNRKED